MEVLFFFFGCWRMIILGVRLFCSVVVVLLFGRDEFCFWGVWGFVEVEGVDVTFWGVRWEFFLGCWDIFDLDDLVLVMC
jgi:hypothetical protein